MMYGDVPLEPPVGPWLTGLIDAGLSDMTVPIAAGADMTRALFFVSDPVDPAVARFAEFFLDPRYRTYYAKPVGAHRLDDIQLVGSDGIVLHRGAAMTQTVSNIMSWMPDSITEGFEQHKYLKLRRIVPISRHFASGEYFVGFTASWRNYAHWTQECLPKLATFITLRTVVPGIKIVLPQFSDWSFQAQAVALLGIGENEIVRVAHDEAISFWRCFVSDNVDIWTVHQYSRHAAYLLSAAVRDEDILAINPSRNIYIHRVNTTRSVANFEQIRPILQKYNFTILSFEDLPLDVQIHAVRNADCIIAEHGAGLANILYAKSGARVLELFNPACVQPAFWSVASVSGVGFGFLVGQHDVAGGAAAPDWNSSYLIAPERLERAINAMQSGEVAAIPSAQVAAALPTATEIPRKVSLPQRKKNLVLGFCANYSFDKVEPFIASFLRFRAGDELCLFATNMDEKFTAVAQRHGIRVEDALPWMAARYHPQNGRFFMYQDFIRKNRDAYAKVMLSDIRDAYFQGNPFDVYFPRQVVFARENTGISYSEINFHWLTEIYSPELAEEIKNNPVSCSGTTLGAIGPMETYIDMMCDEISGRDYDHTLPNDQGMHNYIVWKVRPDYGALDPDDYVYKTVGCTPPASIVVRDGLTFVDGSYAPVIHQWDRIPSLVEHVARDPQFRVPE